MTADTPNLMPADDLTRPCEICKRPVAQSRNSVVCGDRCKAVRQAVHDLVRKYFPTQWMR